MTMASPEKRIRERIRVYGIVQGVGFRPFVARIAAETGIGGSVCNKGPYVEIFSEGTAAQTGKFREFLTSRAPERSSILKTEVAPEPACGETTFHIRESERERGDMFVSPDIAICPKCERELFDPNDRRYLHPFINCTACGPRLTILDSMPYDRARTSMADFPMCEACASEYTDPASRRYHAQPVCCPDCGPKLYTIDPETGRKTKTTDEDAVKKARAVIRAGGIIAVKGIGGFHLCCDATDQGVVRRLRRLKNRPYKAFTVMVRDVGTARRECRIEPGMETVLTGPQKPILLMEKADRSGGARIVDEAAPDNAKLGVMLPYAPVQLLLFSWPDGLPMTDCFIMTSANPSGAPICRDDDDAVQALGGLCDLILSNDRMIRLRADDSVMNWTDGHPYMIRRSRGYAPLPVSPDLSAAPNPGAVPNVLGIGGELKSTFCLTRGEWFYPSPYIADLSDLRSVEALRQAVARMEELLEIRPDGIVCDLHPAYNSSAAARELGRKEGIPVRAIQHHYAHILSLLAECGTAEPVIGVCFDGTGYGTDGTVWGGEFLAADPHGFRRLGSVRPFAQTGGDLAPRQGWRIACALLTDMFDDPDEAAALAERFALCTPQEFRAVQAMARAGINTVTSTSAGRLFDAASALLGFRTFSTCEGEAAMVLQYEAEVWEKRAGMDAGQTAGISDKPGAGIRKDSPESGILTGGDGLFRIDTLAMMRRIVEARRQGEDPGRAAFRFHRDMAEGIAAGCEEARRRTGLKTVGLSGGVLQNTLLLRLTEEALKNQGFRVLTHRMIPPNDSGIALGQAYFGAVNGFEDKGFA